MSRNRSIKYSKYILLTIIFKKLIHNAKYINENKIADFKERKFESYFPFYDPAMPNFSHGIKCST